MNIGELDKIIQIATLTETIVSGDATQVEAPTETVRAKITQLDGSQFTDMTELIGKIVYKIQTWDLNWSHNIKITYGDLVLYPIRPITRNIGAGSKISEVTIYAAAKAGEFVSLVPVTPVTTHTFDDTTITFDDTLITWDMI